MENSNIGFKMMNVVLCLRELDHGFMGGDLDRILRGISVMINALRDLRRTVRAGKNVLAFIEAKEVVRNETRSN